MTTAARFHSLIEILRLLVPVRGMAACWAFAVKTAAPVRRMAAVAWAFALKTVMSVRLLLGYVILGLGNLIYAADLAFVPKSMEFSKALRDIAAFVPPVYIALAWAVPGFFSIAGTARSSRAGYWSAVASSFIWAFEFHKLAALSHWEAPGLVLFGGMTFLSILQMVIVCRDL